jgi:hypothetical protein
MVTKWLGKVEKFGFVIACGGAPRKRESEGWRAYLLNYSTLLEVGGTGFS